MSRNPSLPRAQNETIPNSVPAGLISRLLASIVDAMLVSISFVSLTWFVSVTATMLQLRTFLGFSINAIPGSDTFIDTIFGPASASVLTAAYITCYHIFFWVLTGRTPGKAFLGLCVVNREGKRISPWQGVVRYAGYFISILPLAAGFIWILIDDYRQGWHDKLAGTYVVYSWAARPDERFLAEKIRRLKPNSKPGPELPAKAGHSGES